MTRSSEELNSSSIIGPGPHLARVVNNIDPHRQGAVTVELLAHIGSQRSADQQTYVVKYLSPSFSSTDVEHDANAAPDHHGTQQSHGFWAPAVNTGSTVMVFFVNGDTGQGYYIGGVQDSHANHMVPGMASSKATKDQYKSGSGLKDKSKITDQDNPQLPVAEINRSADVGYGKFNPYTKDQKKAIYTPIVDQLNAQGLTDDTHRGTYTSGSTRESPSNVYGFNSAGPIDKTPGAPKRSIGGRDTQATRHVARLPGHAIILDDGDETKLRKTKPGEGPAEYVDLENGESGGLVTIPKDQQIRIRAANGAQFIMHASEDFIHINNSRGTAWVEITSNGKIDIYTADCVSVHTEADYNITSDRDINLHAGRSVNIYADHDVNLQSKTETHIKADTNIMMSAHSHIAVNAEGGALSMMGSQVVNIVSSGDARIDAKGIDIKSSGHTHMSGTGDISLKGDQLFFGSSSDIHMTSAGTFNTTASQLHLRGYSEIVLYSNTKVDIRSDGDSVIHSDGKISVDSGDAIQVNGTALNLNASGAVKIKGATVDINGPVPDPPHRSAGQSSESAEPHEAVPADPHPTKISADDIPKAPHTGHGSSITSRVPTSQPYGGHEHLNPAGHTQDLTDKLNPSQPYNKDEAKKTVSPHNAADDLSNIPPEQGGSNRKQGANVHGNRRNPYPMYPSTKGDPSSNVVSPGSDISNRGTPSDWVQDQEFMGEVGKLAGKLGVKVPELLALFVAETGSDKLDPSKTNGHGCVGLIQICSDVNPKTGKNAYDELGARNPDDAAKDNLSPQGLRKLTRARQMFWVDKYMDMILPGGGSSLPSKDRIAHIYAAIGNAGPIKTDPSNPNVIYPFSDKRCKQNKLWQDPDSDLDCTVSKMGSWVYWYQKQIIEPKLGAKSYSPDLTAGPASTMQPGPAAGTPPPGNTDSNFQSSAEDKKQPSSPPSVPNAVRWSRYKDKYIAVDPSGRPVDSSGNAVAPEAAYSQPETPESPPTPSASAGLPANLTAGAGLNPDGSKLLQAVSKAATGGIGGAIKTAQSSVSNIVSKIPKSFG